jgi:ABC-2 type transport system permease protein
VEFVYIRGAASRFFVAGICLTIGLLTSFFVEGLSSLRMLGGMFLAVLGNIIHYQVGAILATTAFYWEEAYSVLMVKNMVVGLLSGELLPLNLFPTQWQWVWKVTPFYLYVYGPVQFARGIWSVSEYFQACGIACVWLIFLGFFTQIAWSIGLKKYTSLGG